MMESKHNINFSFLAISTVFVFFIVCALQGCSEIGKSIELNKKAKEVDLNCLQQLNGYNQLSVSSNSTYMSGQEKHQLVINSEITSSNIPSQNPEDYFIHCIKSLSNASKSDFNSIRIVSKPINSNIKENIVIETWNDTVYYLTSGVGFPIDSIKQNGQ